jgi:tetratricopeptide (TPR) repeat protein
MARTEEQTRTCPRCGSHVGYGACPSCALQFTCVHCHKPLENPLGAICGFCRTPIRQPDWTGASTEADGDQGSAEATLPALSVVAARLTGQSLRATASDFAAALVMDGNGKEAVRVLTLALSADGDHPPDRDMLLLRSRAHEVEGNLDEAMLDLVSSVADGTALVPDVAERLHVLLDRQRDARARKRLLRSLVADPSSSEEARNRIDLLRIHAAVIQADRPAADGALRRLLSTSSGELDARALLTGLAETVGLPPESCIALAQLIWDCGAPAQALALIEQVLTATAQDDPPTAERGTAQLLRARLLDNLGRQAEAGRAYFEAGRDLYWRDQFDAAAEPLRQAAAHPTDDPEVVWILADNVRLQAVSKQPPDLAMLQEAADLWAAGRRQAAGIELPAWVLRLRAYLAEDISDYDAEHSRGGMVEGLCALEDCVAITPYRGDMLRLARFHRTFARPATALATLASIESLPTLSEDDDAIDLAFERAVALLEMRSPDAAAQVELVANSSVSALARGWLLATAGRWSESLPPLEQAIVEGPESVIGWLSLGVASLRAGNQHRASDCFQRILQLDEAQVSARFSAPLMPIEARYRTGDYEAAAAMCEQAIAQRNQSIDDVATVYAFLSLSRLAAGHGDVNEAARLALSEARMAGDALGFSTDLTDLEQSLIGDDRNDDARVARHWASRARARSEELRDRLLAPDAAVAEMTAAVDDASDPVEITACRMALTRLMPVSEQAAEIVPISVEILAERPDSPAGAMRLSEAANLVADHALMSGDVEQARAVIGSTQASVPPYRHAIRGALACRGALVSAFAGDAQAAEEEIVSARHEFEQADLNSDEEVIRTWRSTLVAPEQYWRLRRSMPWSGEISRVGDACLSAMLRVNDVSDPATMWPFSTPIIIQIADSLVPADTTAEGPMLGEYIPALRRRLAEQVTATSVDNDQGWLPGVRVRADNTFADGEFQIQVFEIACFRGLVPADSTFCLASPSEALEAVGSDEALSVTPALHPAARTPGAWVSSRLTDRLEGAGLPLWRDPLIYVFSELEHQLRLHVSEFFAVEEVASLVKQHTAGDGDASAADDGDASAAGIDLSLLTSTIRLLLKQGSAVRSWAALLAAARSSRLPSEAAAEYRRTAPGETIGETAATVPVPAHLADLAAREADGARPRASEIFAAADELRQVVSAVEGPVSLMVADPAIREIVHSYVSREFPDIAVVAHEDQAASTQTAGAAT